MLAHGTHQLYRLGKMIEDYIGVRKGGMMVEI